MEKILWHYTRPDNVISILSKREMYATKITSFASSNDERIAGKEIVKRLDQYFSKDEKENSVWNMIKSKLSDDNVFVISFTDSITPKYHVKKYGNIAIGFRFSQMISDFTDHSIIVSGCPYEPIGLIDCQYNPDEVVKSLRDDFLRIFDNYNKTTCEQLFLAEKEIQKMIVFDMFNSAKQKNLALSRNFDFCFILMVILLRILTINKIRCRYVQEGLGVISEIIIFDTPISKYTENVDDFIGKLKTIQMTYAPQFKITDMRKP